MKIIGLSGDYGVGKTTIAKSLTEILKFKGDKKVFCKSLGDVLREDILRNLNWVTRDMLYSKPTSEDSRNFIKGWGQLRKINHYDKDLIWVKQLEQLALNRGASTLVIDDVRFDHEHDYFKDKYKEKYTLVFIGPCPEKNDYSLEYLYMEAKYFTRTKNKSDILDVIDQII